MKGSLLRGITAGLIFEVLIWSLAQIQSFAAVAEMILLPGVWLMQFITPGGVHSDFLGELSGYIAWAMAFVFYAFVFSVLFDILRRRKTHRVPAPS